MTKMVLKRDVWDTLEFAAETVGGVGQGVYVEDDEDEQRPCCLHGIARFLDGEYDGEGRNFDPNEPQVFQNALSTVGITTGKNDNAVIEINAERHHDEYDRVPFPVLMARLGVRRGSR